MSRKRYSEARNAGPRLFPGLPYHRTLDSLPDDGGTWLTINELCERVGVKRRRVEDFIHTLTIRAVTVDKLIRVKLEEALPILQLRPASFIRKCGKDPDDYKVAKLCTMSDGSTLKLYYAPDLIRL